MSHAEASEGAPDIGERLLGREFSDVRLGMLMRSQQGERVTLWWIPVDDDIEGDVRVLSGKITGTAAEAVTEQPSQTVQVIFDRTDTKRDGSKAKVTVQNYLQIPPEKFADFEAHLI